MSMSASKIVRVVLVGFCALLMQIILAPNIRIADAVPDFILLTVIIQAIRLPQGVATSFGFSLGLLFDIISSGTFGLMTLILTVLSFSVSSLNKGTFTEHWVIEILLSMVATLFGELLYGVGTALVNPDLDFFTSLLVIVLPTTLYDALIAAVFLLIIHLLVGGRSSAANPGGFSGNSSGSALSGGSFAGQSANRLGKSSRPGAKLPLGGSKTPGRPINRKLR